MFKSAGSQGMEIRKSEKMFKLKIEHGGQRLSSAERRSSKQNSKMMRGEDHSPEWNIWRHRKTR